MRWTALAIVLVITACAGGDPVATTGAPVATTTTAPVTTMTGTGREIAPDFTLDLNEGGSYTLSETDKPVFLVFWAEWCPTCRKELPVVDRISEDYVEVIDFVAPAWKSGEEAAIAAAAELFPSGNIMWGLDPDEVIFKAYGVPYQPVTVLIGADRTVVEAWAGIRPESEIRQAIENLLAVAG
ncbi:MAG: TlpA family protein disulfide reductase [Actinobacteria bacterium]|nr:TlpA family protein disulfide reductase [Actinomycetota bacterium]